jgi:uncharacterized membrane protein
MKKLVLRDWLILVILIAPFPYLVVAWNIFPDEVPIHFNLHGTPDRYAGKAIGLLLFPVLNIVLYGFLQIIPMVDPKRSNFHLFEDRYRSIRTVVHLLLAFVFFLIAIFSLGYTFDITIAITYALLVMLLFFGNYMSNIRSNYFIGIRTPWTLNNEIVWKKTHRLTGKLWVFSTIVMMVILPFVPSALIIFLVFVAVISIIPIMYSYIEHKNLSNTEHELRKM